MSRKSTFLILFGTSLLLFPLAASAAESDNLQLKANNQYAETIPLNSNEEFSGISKSGSKNHTILKSDDDVFPVRDKSGQIYYNRVLSKNELTKIDYEIEPIASYMFTYQGEIYRNKIVEN